MRHLAILLFTLLGLAGTSAQNTNPNYDSLLASQLNADDYGMKSYVFVILKTGSNTNTDKEFLAKCYKGHFENINKLVAAGKMIVAGPYEKNNLSYRGLFIFDVPSIEEVETLLKDDTAINEGVFDVELFKWYGSAALPVYLEDADKIWKIKP